jgi:hypothetical protein
MALRYSNDETEKERKEKFALAKKIREAIEKCEIIPGAIKDANTRSAIMAVVAKSQMGRSGWDSLRKETEKEMRELAAQLPVHAFAKGVKGFGELGLAIIIGEAGDLSNYPTVSTLWKRMGLAVIDGVRQMRLTDKEAAIRHGYNPKRRAEIWAIADSMFKHQWRGEKEGVPAHAMGDYGAVYGARKLHTLSRVVDTEDLPFTDRNKWTDKRRDNDARRVMTKALLKDVWREWHRAAGTLDEKEFEFREAAD